MRLFLALIFFTLLHLGCTSNDDSSTKVSDFLGNKCVSSKDSYELQETRNLGISVPRNCFPEYDHVQLYKDSLLFVKKRKSSQIDVFDILRKQYSFSFKIDDNFFSNMGNFHVHNLDSIFICNENMGIIMVDKNGKIIDKYKVSIPAVSNNQQFAGSIFFENYGKAINSFDGRRLHLTVASADFWEFEHEGNLKVHGTFDIKNKKWDTVFGAFPNLYSLSQKEPIELPYWATQPYCLVKGDTSIISFPSEHNVYVYNNRTGKLLFSKCIGSKYIKSLLPPFKHGLSDMQVQRNYLIEAPYYGETSYHSRIKMYSRVVLQQQNLSIGNGKVNRPENKKLSIIFFDKNMDIVGEYLTQPNDTFSSVGEYGRMGAIPTSDGFLAKSKIELMPSDDILFYNTVLKIVPKKTQ